MKYIRGFVIICQLSAEYIRDRGPFLRKAHYGTLSCPKIRNKRDTNLKIFSRIIDRTQTAKLEVLEEPAGTILSHGSGRQSLKVPNVQSTVFV